MQNDKLLISFYCDLKDILNTLEQMDYGYAKGKVKMRISEIEAGNYPFPPNPKSDG